MPVQDRYPAFLEDQRQFFDELITEDWETYFSETWDESRRYEIARLFDRVQPATVLDVGCGCGFHDREMAHYAFVQRVDAFDYSEKSVEKANAAYSHPKVRRWVSDFRTEEPAERYDLVVSFQVFEHLSDPVRYFAYSRAATKPGGAVAIFTPNRWRLPNRLRARQALEPQLLDPQHFREYTADEIIALGRNAGLEPDTWFGYGLYGWAWLNRLSSINRLRLGRLLYPMASGLCVILRAR